MNANRGRNDLTRKEVSNAFLFQGAEDANLSVVLGPPIKDRCHLVLARFHKPWTLPKEQAKVDKLFKDLIEYAGKKGFE